MNTGMALVSTSFLNTTACSGWSGIGECFQARSDGIGRYVCCRDTYQIAVVRVYHRGGCIVSTNQCVALEFVDGMTKNEFFFHIFCILLGFSIPPLPV